MNYKRTKTKNQKRQSKMQHPKEIDDLIREAKEKLKAEGYKDIGFLAKGKRGIVIQATKSSKELCIKYRNPFSSVNTLTNEYNILKILEKEHIAPRPIEFKDNYLVMERINGSEIEEFIKKANRNNAIRILWQIIDYMVLLDSLMINKQEMNHPQKHIMIRKEKTSRVKDSDNSLMYKSWLIDFERASYTHNPKNLSQFLSYLRSGNMKKILEEKGICIKDEDVLKIIKEYKAENLFKTKDRMKKEMLMNKLKLYIFIKEDNKNSLRERVLLETSKIPYGKTCSYSYIASKTNTKAFLAIGRILASNPFSPVVPCHRVVKANRELGGYLHQMNNPLKKRLLESEGVRIEKIGNKEFVAEEDFLG